MVASTVAECSADDPLRALLDVLEEEFGVPVRLSVRAPISSGKKKRKRKTISPRLPLHQALVAGRDLFIGADGFTLKHSQSHTAVDSWLHSLGLAKYAMCFARHGLLDFFALPFLTEVRACVCLRMTWRGVMPHLIEDQWWREIGWKRDCVETERETERGRMVEERGERGERIDGDEERVRERESLRVRESSREFERERVGNRKEK
jgi:hypothetical protein